MRQASVLGPVAGVLQGRPRPLPHGRHSSSLGRQRVDAIEVSACGVPSDDFDDRRHHGGDEKALHHYPLEHYRAWQLQWPHLQARLMAGAFGENVSTQGMIEADVCVGDIIRMGHCVVQISQGRQPCWKLNAAFERPDMASQAQDHGRLGWYYRVLEPGTIRAGMTIELLERPHPEWTIAKVHRAVFQKVHSQEDLKQLSRLACLSPRWKQLFSNRENQIPESNPEARFAIPP